MHEENQLDVVTNGFIAQQLPVCHKLPGIHPLPIQGLSLSIKHQAPLSMTVSAIMLF
jgi:hypothetical protein